MMRTRICTRIAVDASVHMSSLKLLTCQIKLIFDGSAYSTSILSSNLLAPCYILFFRVQRMLLRHTGKIQKSCSKVKHKLGDRVSTSARTSTLTRTNQVNSTLLVRSSLMRLPDAHTHPQDDNENKSSIESIQATAVATMGVKEWDWSRVTSLQHIAQAKVIPCYGVHPWFAHFHDSSILDEDAAKSCSQMPGLHAVESGDDSVLSAFHGILHVPACQDKMVLADKLRKQIAREIGLYPDIHDCDHLYPSRTWASKLENLLSSNPRAVVGECGLDRAAVIPGTRAQVSQQHQVALVAYHLRLAAKYGRPISMHCVRATGPLQDLLTSTPSDQLPQRIMVHSFGGPPDSVKQLLALKNDVGRRLWFSFSYVINASKGEEARAKLVERVKAVPDDRLLIESDQNSPTRIDAGLEAMLEIAAQAKGWSTDQAVEILVRNFETFYDGFLPEGYQR